MIADSQQFITQQIKVESVYQFDLNQSSSSIKENHIHQVQSQNLHQIELDNYHGKKSSKDNIFYKKQLLQLMVMVKLEKYGLQKRETKPLIAREMEKIQHIQLIQNKSLNQLAMEMSQNVLFHVFQEIAFQLPRFRRLRSLMKVQMDNESQIQRQRADFMPQRQQIQRSQHLAPEILCSICYTVSNRYLSQSCGHSFCMDCINGYLSQNLSSGNFIVKCPEFDCKQFISNDNIKKALQKKDNQKFLYFKQKYQKENNPENKFCTKPDCGQLLVSINDCLKCNKCSEEYCEICLLKYHGNNPCDIALKNALQQDFKTFKIKKCPNCKSPIEKSDGCNHMCCKKCKFQFCWICLKKYTTHHYRYYNCFGCPGMQFENENQLIYQRCKQITFFCLLPFVIFLLFVCFLSAIPIYMVGSFIYKPCHWLHEDKDYCQYIIASKMCCCFGQLIIKIFAWFLYLPRALLYMAFVAPVRLTISFCIEICKIFQ